MIYESERATITYDPDVPCVTWTPKGFLKGDEFKEPFMAGMEFLEKEYKSNQQIQWLNDARNLKTVGPDDIKWLNSNVNDRAYKIGVQRVAFVLPENIFGKWAIKIYVDFTNKRADNKLDIKAFKSMAEAKNWLKAGTGSDVPFI